jgi:hypothetical protein
MTVEFNGHLPTLKSAFQRGQLTLYVGAGVSKDNGLPSWEELVQALYFTTLQDEACIEELKPYPNYLFALAQWVLRQKNEPLDIIIRKLRQWYEGKDFIGMLSRTLYAGFGRELFGDSLNGLPDYLVQQNGTLRAIIDCCRRSVPGTTGLRAIVSYNYDNLIELALTPYDENRHFQVISQGRSPWIRGRSPSITSTASSPIRPVSWTTTTSSFRRTSTTGPFRIQCSGGTWCR